MSISDYSYHLPEDLIAQKPLLERAASRMLVVSRTNKSFYDSEFAKFPELLREGDILVVNNTRVFPARLIGRSSTGAKIEVLLIKPLEQNKWEALARPARRLRPGRGIEFGGGLSAITETVGDGGRVVIRFASKQDLFETIERSGQVPLPPYIRRPDTVEDRSRYQTVYARDTGAIAAPTAGLHFTDNVLDRIRSRGVTVAEITLHVGYGTFEPVRSEDLSAHSVLPETVRIDAAAAQLLNAARSEKRRIVAVGTTTTRALEWNISRFGEFVPAEADADLTIVPGYEFKAIDGLLTNFHLPKSSLLILVSTFAGRDLIINAYEHAVAERYRFYSYGDCMFIS